jgi:hypothetical protein
MYGAINFHRSYRPATRTPRSSNPRCGFREAPPPGGASLMWRSFWPLEGVKAMVPDECLGFAKLCLERPSDPKTSPEQERPGDE